MRKIIVAIFVMCLFGCGTSGITIYKMVEGKAQPFAQVDQSFMGKGCVAVDYTKEGKASVIVQQAGTSDWSISRMFGFMGDIAGNVFGGNRGMQEMQGPATGMQGCEGLFDKVKPATTPEVKPDRVPIPGVIYRIEPVEPVEPVSSNYS